MRFHPSARLTAVLFGALSLAACAAQRDGHHDSASRPGDHGAMHAAHHGAGGMEGHHAGKGEGGCCAMMQGAAGQSAMPGATGAPAKAPMQCGMGKGAAGAQSHAGMAGDGKAGGGCGMGCCGGGGSCCGGAKPSR